MACPTGERREAFFPAFALTLVEDEKMTNTTLLAIAVVVLAGGVACNQARKSGPEAALDRAYQSGILSKGEYEAKKAALLAPTAPPAAVPVAAPVAAPVVAPAAAPEPAPAAPADPPAARPVAAVARVSRPVKPAAQPAAVPEPAVETREPVRVQPAPVAQVEETREPAPPAACADTEIRPGKEKGKQERFYPMPPSKVRAALLKSLNDLEFHIHKATDTEIEASKKRHIGLVAGSGGEKMTIHLEAATEGGRRGTLVAGETKKGLVMRAGQKSWTNAILDQANCVLHTGGPATQSTY